MVEGKVPGRANTPEEKRAIIERLYKAWCKTPHQRFGQLLSNARRPSMTLFYVEDDDLAKDVETFVQEIGPLER